MYDVTLVDVRVSRVRCQPFDGAIAKNASRRPFLITPSDSAPHAGNMGVHIHAFASNKTHFVAVLLEADIRFDSPFRPHPSDIYEIFDILANKYSDVLWAHAYQALTAVSRLVNARISIPVTSPELAIFIP